MVSPFLWHPITPRIQKFERYWSTTFPGISSYNGHPQKPHDNVAGKEKEEVGLKSDGK